MTNTKTGTASNVPSGLGSGTLNADGSLTPIAPPVEAFVVPLSVASPTDAGSDSWWGRLETHIPAPMHRAFLAYLDRLPDEETEAARKALAALADATDKVRAFADDGLALVERRREEMEAAREAAAAAILANKKAPAPFDADGWALALSQKAAEAGPLVGAASAAVAALDAELLELGPTIRHLIVEDLAANAARGREAAALADACVHRDEALRHVLDIADLSDHGVHTGEYAIRRATSLRATDGYRSAVRKEGGHLNAANLLRDALTSERTIAALAEWKPGDTA